MNGEIFEYGKALERLSLPTAGQPLSLNLPASKLLEILPTLKNSATVYRTEGVILCYQGHFPKPTQFNGYSFFKEGARGLTANLHSWCEVWWYREERHGELLSSLEIANSFGQGMIKLCYRDEKVADSAFQNLVPFVSNKGDGWDILHLRRANNLTCADSCRRGKKSAYFTPLRAVVEEHYQRGLPLGFVTPNEELSIWDTLTISSVSRICCWLTIDRGGDFLFLQPASIHHTRINGHAGRRILTFFHENDTPIISFIEPPGAELSSFDHFENNPCLKT